MDIKVDIIAWSTPVITKNGKIKGHITAICIRDKNITYEISHFKNGERKEDWLYRFEFEVDDAQPKAAGFKYDNAPVILK